MKALFETITLLLGAVYVMCLVTVFVSGTISSPGALIALASAFALFRVLSGKGKPPRT